MLTIEDDKVLDDSIVKSSAAFAMSRRCGMGACCC